MRFRTLAAFIAMAALCAVPRAIGQDRDFLNGDEVDQIREAQEPNARLQLYIQFAQQRIALIKQLLGQDKVGRSLLVHDTLEDYGKIIDAIDTVADDALQRKLDITEGMKIVAPGEKAMAADLQKIADKPPKDYSRFEFVLTQALDATNDSAELSAEDLSKRSTEVQAQAAREKKALESMMPAKEAAARDAQDKAAADDKTKRKPPSLLKPGETPAVQ
jgi:hypothetical protein